MTSNPTPETIAAALHAELVVVVPVFNEAGSIRTVVEEWQECLETQGMRWQMLLLNDGSTDHTKEKLEACQANAPERLLVVTKPNSGHGATCRLGYESAVLAPQVEWIFQIDSDGQCDPCYFPAMWKARHDADAILGRRVRRDDGVARWATSKLCQLGSSLLAGINLIDPNVPYRLIRKSTLQELLCLVPETVEIQNVAQTFMLARMKDIRLRHEPIHFRERQAGHASLNLRGVARLGIAMLGDLIRLRRRKPQG